MKETNKLTLTIYSVVILSATFTELMAYINDGHTDIDFFSYAIGLVAWFGFSMHSQQIVDKNQFQNFGLVGLAIFFVSIVKQSLTTYHPVALAIAALPLFYIVYFKLMLAIFYDDYPKNKPTIIYSSKLGRDYYQGDDQGYVPTNRERVFSLFLFIGFMIAALWVGFILHKITN